MTSHRSTAGWDAVVTPEQLDRLRTIVASWAIEAREHEEDA